MIKYLDNDFAHEIANKKVLVDFYADWCGPCKMMTPTLEEVSKEISFDILKVDVDKYQDVAVRYNVFSIPNISLFENGKLIKSHTGYLTPKELLKFIEEDR